MVRLLVLLLVMQTFCDLCLGLKILSVFHTTSKSHNIVGDGVNRHLLNAGHEVTYITSFLKKDPHPNLRQIDVTNNFNMIPEERRNRSSLSPETKLNHELVILVMHLITVMTFENENVTKLINDPKEHFDAVIVDYAFNEILFSGLAYLYDAPLIWVSTTDPHWLITTYVDEALHPAYSSDVISNNVPPFNFWQRASELWTQIKVTFYQETILKFFDTRAYNNFIAPAIKARGKEPPSPQDLRNNASLVLGNSHPSYGEAHRLPANYISLGGFHVEDNNEPLPEYLEKIMNNAKNGIIYFSMGSLIQSKDLPEDTKKALITMFGQLKQTVIWKFEADISNLPKNVHVIKWAPQQSILSHPNCSLFITHGGLLSTTETIHHGVPIIGIPVFADQYNNVDKAIHRGIGTKITFSMSPVLAEDLKGAIEEVLGNPKYTEKVKELSLIYHHRPVKPGVEVVHWIEHAVLTKGAPHLRSPALRVPWYQKMYIDLAIVIVLLALTIRFLYRNVKRILFKKSVSEKKNK